MVERVIVEISDKAKVPMFVEMLNSMDFVQSVTTVQKKSVRKQIDTSNDFFALAGIWADRDVTIDSIRTKAWPKRTN
ncbi:MAG: hypothetical protein DYG89_50845 [Caldilinea sp. CFX5]|nr:hypothetical protein [Caldilinea sp. CFX5]